MFYISVLSSVMETTSKSKPRHEGILTSGSCSVKSIAEDGYSYKDMEDFTLARRSSFLGQMRQVRCDTQNKIMNNNIEVVISINYMACE